MTDYSDLRRLLAAATPGPWRVSPSGGGIRSGRSAVAAWDAMEPQDSALVAAMRNALPGLLDEVEKLKADGDHLDELGSTIRGLIDAVPAAQNYLQLDVVSKATGKSLLLTIQRKDGKSPGQLVDELKAEVQWLRAEADLGYEIIRGFQKDLAACLEVLSDIGKQRIAESERIEDGKSPGQSVDD